MKLFNFITIFFLAWIPTNGISTNLKPTASFRSPKNIAFASFGGGSSHHMWVFRILKDMHSRGHNVSFFSRGDQLHFAEGFSVMTIKELGGAFDLLHHPTPVLRHIPFHPHPEVVGTGILESALLNYPVEFFEYQSLPKSEKIDLVICVFFSICCNCFEDTSYCDYYYCNICSAKYVNNRLYTILHPTSEYTSVWERALCDYFRIPMIKIYLLKHTTHVAELPKITQSSIKSYMSSQ
ncbi:hypothetical protein EDC94DRAFT_35870 [Helicostylum pulchrum]|nr:hypothetical protein EDC94DRAFT_35870 [Helicostylum pulchrum]